MKIFNAATMRKELAGKVKHIRLYNGTKEANLSGMAEILIDEAVVVKSETWDESEGRERVLNERRGLSQRLQNAATGYDPATIAAYVLNLTIDLDRLKDDMTDFTPILVTEKTDENATDPVKLRNYLPYIGKEGVMMGASDTVPLMEHNLPVDVNVPLQIKAFGDKTTFRELYLNPFHKTENILQSAARILADSQNKEVIGKIITADYTAAAFNQPADTTGATADLKIYNTVKKAIKKALMLYNTPTGKRIGEMQHEIYLLINPLDLYDVEPVINGGLERLAGINQMVGRLPFNGVIPYAGGINDGLKWGNETLSFPGVPLGKFFILIKNPVYGGYKVIKRSPSMEMGNGDVLALTTEKRAWHRIDGVFLDWLLPGGTPQKPAGAVISGTFPAAA